MYNKSLYYYFTFMHPFRNRANRSTDKWAMAKMLSIKKYPD